jgi:hypothetical protein
MWLVRVIALLLVVLSTMTILWGGAKAVEMEARDVDMDVVWAWKRSIKDKIEISVGMLWKRRVHPSRYTYTCVSCWAGMCE